MTIFDHIGSILNTKNYIKLNCDDESQFNSFMINRWCSFYSPEINDYINNTANVYVSQFTSKQEQYDYYFHLLPKCKFKKIEYIKKVKKEEEAEKKLIPEFMSQKEYSEYVDLKKLLNI